MLIFRTVYAPESTHTHTHEIVDLRVTIGVCVNTCTHMKAQNMHMSDREKTTCERLTSIAEPYQKPDKSYISISIVLKSS